MLRIKFHIMAPSTERFGSKFENVTMVIGTHKKPTPTPVNHNAQAISKIYVIISNVAI